MHTYPLGKHARTAHGAVLEGNGKETLKIIKAIAENDFLNKGSLECSDRSFPEDMCAFLEPHQLNRQSVRPTINNPITTRNKNKTPTKKQK